MIHTHQDVLFSDKIKMNLSMIFTKNRCYYKLSINLVKWRVTKKNTAYSTLIYRTYLLIFMYAYICGRNVGHSSLISKNTCNKKLEGGILGMEKVKVGVRERTGEWTLSFWDECPDITKYI